MLDVTSLASYTLTNGGGSSSGPGSTHGSVGIGRGKSGGGGIVRIQDSRWRFQDDSQLPRPREFVGGPKRYRAGRVSSVPFDLKSLE